MPPRSLRGRGAFSLVDIMISIGIAAVLSALIIGMLARSRAAAQNVTCLTRLRSIAQSFAQYTSNNEGRFPDPYSMQISWEACIEPRPSGALEFSCPSDAEVFPIIGSSYDWRDTGIFSTTIAGRTMGDVIRPTAVLAFETLPGWHTRGKMNAAQLDGSTCTMDQEHCLADLQTPIRSSGPN